MMFIQKTTHAPLLTAALLAMGLVACGGPPEVPKNPTWAEHVYPIMAGQCLHCHGDTADVTGGTYRFDFFDPTDCGDLATRAGVSDGAFAWKATILTNPLKIDPDLTLTRPRMPPEPGRLLEDWELQTLLNWDTDKGEMPSGNAKPGIQVVSTKKDGDDLDVTYIVSDPDGDPVLGEIDVDGQKFPLTRSGGGTITVTDAASSFTLAAELCDGWQTVKRDVDVKK